MIDSPELLIFAQHGWSDTAQDLEGLVRSLAPSNGKVIAPSLDFWTTWLRIEPLIRQKEAIVAEAIAAYPKIPIRVVGHSMGGLIWTELLHRHPEWWPRIESFILVGSPIGGSDLARLIDPLGLGIGIARDLGLGRRALAAELAQHIPMLVIAADIGEGTDGMVTVECTKIPGAQFVLLPNIPHATMKVHPKVGEAIQQFWAHPSFVVRGQQDLGDRLLEQLYAIPGMTDASYRNFPRAKIWHTWDQGLTLRTWKNSAQIEHVFLADAAGDCLFAGYVGWLHNADLKRQLVELKNIQST